MMRKIPAAMPIGILAVCLASVQTPSAAHAGVILSEEVTVGIREGRAAPVHENLLDSMDLLSLSPAAGLLARPMVSRELALAMKRGLGGPSPDEWRAIVRKAAAAYLLPEALVSAVIHTESSFQTDAVSPKGAQGAMQIMPQTQRELGLADPFDAEANVMAGCAYLRKQLDSFGSLELALAAYNAGPGNVRKFGGVPPFAETLDYVRKVIALAGSPQAFSLLRGGSTSSQGTLSDE